MTTGRKAQVASLLFSLMTSPHASADMRVKVEQRFSSVGGSPGIAKSWASTEIYYVQGSARRKEAWDASRLDSAFIRHCDTGEAYFVDFGQKQYWKVTPPVRHANPSAERGDARGATPGSNPARVPTVRVLSQTVESGRPRVILGRTARHYVTSAKEFLDGPNGIPYAEETIDGWYWSEVPRLRSGCMPEDLATQPLSWIGEPDPVVQAKSVFEHSGPSPTGFVVEETRTVRSRPSHVRGGWDVVTSIESKVVEFSDAPLDPSLFIVPKGFRKIPNPTAASTR